MKRLTKSQYEMIAEAVVLLRGVIEPKERRLTAEILAGKLAQFDNQFDKPKFLELCGITD